MSNIKLKIQLVSDYDDAEQIYRLLEELHKESRFRAILLSREKFDSMISTAIESREKNALLVAKLNDELVGFIYCSIGELLVGSGQLLTTVLAFYVRGRFRRTMLGGRAALRLLSSAIEWSRQQKSTEIMIHVTSGVDIQRTDKFLRRARFKVIGANYSFAIGSSEAAN